VALVVLGADKGAPGVTTTTVALAAVWSRAALVAECDPAGGDLIYRLPAADGSLLDPNLGLLSLAAAARRGLEPVQVWEHAQALHGGLSVIVGTAGAEQSAGLAGLWAPIGHALSQLPDADVFADCGRLGVDAPATQLMRHAAVVLLVARADTDQVAHLRDRIATLTGELHRGAIGRPPIGVLMIVEPRHRERVVAQVNELLRASDLPAQVVGTVANDPVGAALLGGRGRGRAGRSLLVRSVRAVALELSRRFGVQYAGRG
jgi:hypothetical protein